jgi:hypothetical protein
MPNMGGERKNAASSLAVEAIKPTLYTFYIILISTAPLRENEYAFLVIH